MLRLIRDVRVGLRSLRSRPAFATTAVLALALGIGLSAAVFTVANALLLRPLPVREQDRLIALWGKRADQTFDYPLGLDAARDVARRSRAMQRVGFYAYEGAYPVLIREGGEVSRMRRALVSGEFFPVLDVRPHLGRALRPADDAWGAERAIVLSYATWRQRFGADTGVVGRRVTLHGDGAVYTIVGVMPLGLDYPRGTDFWAPIYAVTPARNLEYAAVNLVGRLARGATPDHARDELTAFFARADAPRWQRGMRGVSSTFTSLIVGDTRPALFAFAAAAGLLLLIACVNVANLLLVRGLTRVREMAVRSALGAERKDLMRQLLTEHALLAVAGGVLGAAVGSVALRTFLAFAPETLPRLNEIRVSVATLGGAIGAATIALLLFAVAPALIASRTDLQVALRSDSRQTAGKRSRAATEFLVAGQVALALMVLSAAGLITRSLVKLERADFAFDESRLLIAELGLRYDQLDDARKQRDAIDRLLPLIARIPQVQSLSPVVAAPFSGPGGWDGRPAREGQTNEEAARNPMLNMEVVAPAYFETFRMPVLRGRGFTDADREGAQAVVVVSQSTARHYWPGADPLGKRLLMGGMQEIALTVVGVVHDTRYRDLREARPSIYFPLRQAFFPFTATELAIRTRGDPADAVAAIRRVVADATPGIALASAAPFEDFLGRPLAQPRLNALLLAVFASACVALSAIGLFGVMSTMVRQRTREFGVRMALGATPAAVMRLVVGRGLAIIGAGLGAGLLGALLANRLLGSLLYGVSPNDATTFVGAILLLAVVAAITTFLPARVSMRIDAVSALRVEG